MFMLEHQFCSTVGEKGETTIWRQVTGISIGSSCSGILANLTRLMGEIDMLENLERKGIVLSTYNRYVDDITAISDVKDMIEKGKLFLTLEEELNKLDPIGSSIEDKPGLREWWEACTEEGITNSFGNHFSEAEIELLPKRLFKCVRTTKSIADFVKKRGKR